METFARCIILNVTAQKLFPLQPFGPLRLCSCLKGLPKMLDVYGLPQLIPLLCAQRSTVCPECTTYPGASRSLAHVVWYHVAPPAALKTSLNRDVPLSPGDFAGLTSCCGRKALATLYYEAAIYGLHRASQWHSSETRVLFRAWSSHGLASGCYA